MTQQQQQARKAKRAEYNKRYYQKNRQRILARKRLSNKAPKALKVNGSTQVELNHGGGKSKVLSFPQRPTMSAQPKQKEAEMRIVQDRVQPLASSTPLRNQWLDIGYSLCEPASALLLVVTGLLTTIMAYQASLFFHTAGESHPWIAAVIAELLLVIGSVCLVLYQGALRKLIWVGMAAFIGVYGSGLYQTFNQKALEAVPAIQALEKEISGLESELETARSERDALPLNYITKRNQLTEKRIAPAAAKLDAANLKLQSLRSEQKSSASVVSYSLLRILLMLLNGLLVHRLASRLIDKNQQDMI